MCATHCAPHPTPQSVISIWVSSLPTAGTLHTAPGARALTADQLPLQLPTGRIWYTPPRDATSPTNTSAGAVGAFSFFVNDGHQDSLPARVSLVVSPANDACAPQLSSPPR